MHYLPTEPHRYNQNSNGCCHPDPIGNAAFSLPRTSFRSRLPRLPSSSTLLGCHSCSLPICTRCNSFGQLQCGSGHWLRLRPVDHPVEQLILQSPTPRLSLAADLRCFEAAPGTSCRELQPLRSFCQLSPNQQPPSRTWPARENPQAARERSRSPQALSQPIPGTYPAVCGTTKGPDLKSQLGPKQRGQEKVKPGTNSYMKGHKPFYLIGKVST